MSRNSSTPSWQEDVSHGKPTQELFLKAAALMACPGPTGLVYEDGDLAWKPPGAPAWAASTCALVSAAPPRNGANARAGRRHATPHRIGRGLNCTTRSSRCAPHPRAACRPGAIVIGIVNFPAVSVA